MFLHAGKKNKNVILSKKYDEWNWHLSEKKRKNQSLKKYQVHILFHKKVVVTDSQCAEVIREKKCYFEPPYCRRCSNEPVQIFNFIDTKKNGKQMIKQQIFKV